MNSFKPEVRYELSEKLIGYEYCKVYTCRHCGERLRLGQSTCKCGMIQCWDGIEAWDKIQRKRKRLAND